VKLHKPELLDFFKPTQFELHLMEQGNEVEAWVRKLFPAGRLITATEDAACLEMQRLMAASTDDLLSHCAIEPLRTSSSGLLASIRWSRPSSSGTQSIWSALWPRSNLSYTSFHT